MEEKCTISETRLSKERELLRSYNPSNCSVSFPENTPTIEVSTSVQGFPIKFYLQLPERYPFQPPLVTSQVDRNLAYITVFENEESILEHVMGESWLPIFTLPSIIDKLVSFAESTYKPRTTGLLTAFFQRNFSYVIVIAFLFRLAVMTQSHSGQNNPPMFGDYEAQRHWMEITYNLPAELWYENTDQNDLQYWGLDYPPLSAWHSLVMGAISALIEPSSMELSSSRGYDTHSHKIFMRITVLVSECMVFIPALIVFFKLYYKNLASGVSNTALLLVLVCPTFVLIDHGHFQYNNVMMGFFLWAVVLVLYDYLAASAVLLALSICYKQMALYYVLPFAVVWLKKALARAKVASAKYRKNMKWPIFAEELGSCFISILGCGVITCLVVWCVWIREWASFFQVLQRVFPFQRGLFEHKVANFWCISSVFFRFKQVFSIEFMVPLTTVVTLTVSVVFLLLFYKRKAVNLSFLYALAGVSLTFFLFSFHVHEKTIMLALLPFALISIVDFPEMFRLFAVMSTFSMYPLLIEDGLRAAYFVSNFVFYFASGDYIDTVNYYQGRKGERLGYWYIGIIIVHLLEAINPPQAYPYMFDLLVAGYAFLGNMYLLYFIFKSMKDLRSVSNPKHHLEVRLRKKAKMT